MKRNRLNSYINVHPNEDNDAEVGVQSVADEQGREDDPPGRTAAAAIVAIENIFHLKKCENLGFLSIHAY